VPLIKLVVGSFLVDSKVVVEDTRLIEFAPAVVADRGSKESSLHKSV